MSATEDRQSSISTFWKWFSAHLNLLETISFDPKVFDKMITHANKIDPNIEFLYAKSDTDRNELYVSCGGMHSSIPAVEDLVKACPKFAKWDIIAFKQRLSDDAFQTSQDKVVFDDTYEVDPFSAKMAIQPNGDKYDIWIFSPADKMDDGHKAAYFILLDMLIGEYIVMTKLAGIEFCEDDGSCLTPLIKIREIL